MISRVLDTSSCTSWKAPCLGKGSKRTRENKSNRWSSIRKSPHQSRSYAEGYHLNLEHSSTTQGTWNSKTNRTTRISRRSSRSASSRKATSLITCMIGYSFHWQVGILLSQRKYQSPLILSRMRNSLSKSISSPMIPKIIYLMTPVTKGMTMKYRIYIRTSKDRCNSSNSNNHPHCQHKMAWEILKAICLIQITWTTTTTITEVLVLAILLHLCRCSSSNSSNSINSNNSHNRTWITIRINSSRCINSSNSNTIKMGRSLSKQLDKLDHRKYQTKKEKRKKEIVISSDKEKEIDRERK